jgi:hypothetical protein
MLNNIIEKTTDDNQNNKQYIKINQNDNPIKLIEHLGYDGLIISTNIFIDLYKLINEALEMNKTPDELKIMLYYAANKLPSYILVPPVLINIEHIMSSCYDTKCFADLKLKYIYDNYWKTFSKTTLTYNPNHFNLYPCLNKNLIRNFDWVFYKHFYDDLINNDLIESYKDAIIHYIKYGYNELRYICMAEYLYDKNDSELETLIQSLDIQQYEEKNKSAIEEKNLSKMPIIFLICYDYKQI